MADYMNHTVENELYRLQTDSQNGAIRSIFDKAGSLELIAEPRLADSFRLLVPLPDMHANYIFGTGQQLSSVKETAAGLVLHWDSPLVNDRGRYDIDVTLRIQLTDQAVEFQISLTNHTEHKIAEVWAPIFGGVLGLGERRETRTLIPSPVGVQGTDLFRSFPESMGVGGGGGFRFPEYALSYPRNMPMPWMDMYNDRLGRGIYFGAHDLVARYAVLRFEMHPGLARNRLGGNWPREDEYDDRYPWGLVVNWTNFPYTPPGQTFQGPVFTVQAHTGDWHAAAKIYRQWFTSQFELINPRDNWLHCEPGFQGAMFLLPEDNVLMTLKDIPGWAADAVACGVRSLHIAGWMVGGHDNQYPLYEPDPRLGTWEDLAQAIRACHELRCKVWMFVNLQPMDSTTAWYKAELHKYRSMFLFGDSHVFGYGMGTLGARLGLTFRPMVKANPAFAEFRQIICRQMVKLAEIGADGIHFDKFYPEALDFNPDLPLPPDRAGWEGSLLALDETLQACRAINPHFALSLEIAWDRTLCYTGVMWHWHDALDHSYPYKYAFPEVMPMMAVVQPYDYANVNNAARHGYQNYLGPARYSRSLGDEQYAALARYIREVYRIRNELKDIVLLGEFLDQLEVSVQADKTVLYNTHRNPATGRRACVLVNMDYRPQRATIAFHPNPTASAKVYLPFEKVRGVPLPVQIEIPPERVAFVVES